MSTPVEHLASEIALAEVERDRCMKILEEADKIYNELASAKPRANRGQTKAASDKRVDALRQYTLRVERVEELLAKQQENTVQKRGLPGGSTTAKSSQVDAADTHGEKRTKNSKTQAVNQVPAQEEGLRRSGGGRDGPNSAQSDEGDVNSGVRNVTPPAGDATTTQKEVNSGDSALPAGGAMESHNPKEVDASTGDKQFASGPGGKNVITADSAAVLSLLGSSEATNALTGGTANNGACGAKDAENAAGGGGTATGQVVPGEMNVDQTSNNDGGPAQIAVGGGGTATGQVAPGGMNGDQTSNDDGNPAPKEKKRKVAKNKEESAKIPWEELSQEQQEKLTADGKLAIKDFHKAFEAFGFDDAAKRLRLSKEVLNRIQTDQAYLPEAATSSMELGEAILLSNRSNSRCLFHQRKDKSGSNYDGHSQGSAKYFKILGVPGPRVMKLKKSDAKEPDEGLLHCGCAVDSALWELIWWKTWSVTCDVEGELVTESLLTDLPSPRMRLFIITALEAQGIRLEDFYTAISKDQTVRKNKIATLKDRLVKLLDKVNDLDSAKDGMQYIVARANRFRDEDDDGADARKEGKGKGKKRKVAQDDGDDDDDGSETDGDAKKKGKAKQKAPKKETKGGPKKKSKVSE